MVSENAPPVKAPLVVLCGMVSPLPRLELGSVSFWVLLSNTMGLFFLPPINEDVNIYQMEVSL